MSVPEQMPIVEYAANGTTTRFPITFDLHDVGYLNVFINKELAPIGSYTVDNFEAVVFATAPNENDEVTLIRDTQLDRETNYQSFDNSFRPAAVNYDFDKIWHVLQEQNLIDGKLLARLKEEIEWRRTHDFNYDELAQVREKQLFDALKGYTDTLVAAVNPGIFQGVIAGVVFAQDGRSIQTHIEDIYLALAAIREVLDSSATIEYVDSQNSLQNEVINTKASNESVQKLESEKATYLYVDEKIATVSGGLVGSYKTLALAQSATSKLPANSSLKVTNDPDPTKNGEYTWDGNTLTKSDYDPLTLSKAYTDRIAKLLDNHILIVQNVLNNDPVNLVNPSDSLLGYVTAWGTIENTDSYKDKYISTGFLPIVANKKLQMWARKGQAAWLNYVVLYDIEKNFLGKIDFPASAATTGITEIQIPALVNSKQPYFARFSNLTQYHQATDLYISFNEINPKRIIAFDAKKLIETKVSNERILSAVTMKTEYIESENLLKTDHVGTVGYLNNTLEPVTTGAYVDWWLTTAWIDIPLDTKFIVIVGNILAYTVKNSANAWYQGKNNGLEESLNVNTLIDLSQVNNGGSGVPDKLRVTFRRFGSDTTAAQSETWAKCGVYMMRSSCGCTLDKLFVQNTDFNSDLHNPSDFLITHNLFSVARSRGYPISSNTTNFQVGYLEGSNSLITTGQYYNSWRTSPALICVPSASYQLVGTTGYTVTFLDIDRKFLSYKYLSNTDVFTAPANAKYMRLSVATSTAQSCALYQIDKEESIKALFVTADEQIKVAKNDIIIANSSNESSLKDKKWLALGDSITNNPQSYANQLAAEHGAILTKHTLDGTWVHKGIMADIPRVLSESYQDIATTTQFDLITVACAVNDRFNRLTGFTTASTKVYLKDSSDKVLAESTTDSTGFFGFEVNDTAGLKVTKADNNTVSTTVSAQGSLGVMSDRTTATFYGALHVLLKGLRDKFPLSRIGYISQIQSTWQPYMRNEKNNIAWIKTQAILDVCSYYGIEVWIGCDKFGFNPRDNETLKAAYMPDGLHPNTAGHTWYANRVEQFILSLAN